MNLQKKKLFLLDMDGTIYLDQTLFEGTLDFLSAVRKNHRTVRSERLRKNHASENPDRTAASHGRLCSDLRHGDRRRHKSGCQLSAG